MIRLELQDISKQYPSVKANDRVSLRVEAGTVHAILGENGAGKSTLMKILFGMVRPDTGGIVYQGRELAAGHRYGEVMPANVWPDRPEGFREAFLDLFAALDATDDQLDFPMLYASGRQGWAVVSLDDERKDLSPLFDLVLRHVPAPKLDANYLFLYLKDPYAT